MSYIYANLSGGSCGWLWLRLRLYVWLWLERVRHCYTYRPTQSLDHTLIVGVHPSTLGPHLPHLGPHLPHLGPQTLYLCGVASSPRALGGAGVIVHPP